MATTLSVAGVAHAAGVEDTVGGAVGLGRAAYFARVNDFMATWQNPANLAVIPGGDLGIELRLPILQACFDREKNNAVTYKESPEDSDRIYFESFVNVCNEALPSPTGNIGWAQSFDSGWGWGLGLFTPAGVGSSKWGNDTNVTVNVDEEEEIATPTLDGVESPTRQMGIERSAITAYLMGGLGWEPIKQLRIGGSAGIGFGSVYNKSVVSTQGGTFADAEVINELTVSDYAIARATGGLVIAPVDALELFGTITYQGDLRGKGEVELSANGLKGEPLANCRDKDPGTHCKLNGVQLTVPFQTLEATFGVRISQRRNKRERVLDPMKDEVWDFEIDANWAQTSHVDAFRVKLHNDDPPLDSDDPDERVPGIQFTSREEGASTSVPNKRTMIPKYWKDTWTLRAGGDINIVPDRFAFRLGASYQNRAVRLPYMNIDYWPVQKIGIHVGFTLKFLERFKATLGYAHLFFEKIRVPLGTGMVKDIVTLNPDGALAVNEGTYQAALDVVSLQLNAQF